MVRTFANCLGKILPRIVELFHYPWILLMRLDLPYKSPCWQHIIIFSPWNTIGVNSLIDFDDPGKGSCIMSQDFHKCFWGFLKFGYFLLILSGNTVSRLFLTEQIFILPQLELAHQSEHSCSWQCLYFHIISMIETDFYDFFLSWGRRTNP